MILSKANIITQLQRDILLLQGFKLPVNKNGRDTGLGFIKFAFPNAEFPLAAIHEFISSGHEDTAATGGFVCGLLASLMNSRGACIWISSSRTIFPPALKSFGIAPDRIIFIDLQNEKQILWAMEEALKCNGLSAVIGEIRELSFNASRRLQLAVEQSRVTGFILRPNPRSINITACNTRWRITPLSSKLMNDMPGVGFPRWKVELLKVRNGNPATWQIEFVAGRFRHTLNNPPIVLEQQKKVG